MTINIQDRLNFWQKCCCLYNILKKDLSNATVHYEEAKEHFPREFKTLGGIRAQIKMVEKVTESDHKQIKVDPMGMTITSHQDLLSAHQLDQSATQMLAPSVLNDIN